MNGLLAVLALASLVAVRNPFAPIGADVPREEISADYHLTRAKRLAAEKAAAERAESMRRTEEAKKKPVAPSGQAAPASRPISAALQSLPADDDAWSAAMKLIRVGGRIRARRADGTERASVILDGKPCGEGDLTSVVSGGRRFTWRVTGVEGDRPKLRLERVEEHKVERKE